jgi:hypothetical protein
MIKTKRVDTVVYVDDIDVPVTVIICPAEPDVGIMQDFVEVDSIDLSAVYEHVREQLEAMPINDYFEDPRY